MAWSDHLERADRATRDILGSSVIYAPEFGTPVTVTGIFEAQHAEPSGPGQIDVGGWGPSVFLTLADLPVDPETDNPTITVGAIDYTVRKARKDGQGGVLLLLNRVED